MQPIPNHDRYLDPPDPPTYGECDGCHERFDYDDMTKVGWQWYCKDCLRDIQEAAG